MRRRALTCLVAAFALEACASTDPANTNGGDSQAESAPSESEGDETVGDASSASSADEGMLESLELSIRDNPASTINPFGDLELVGSADPSQLRVHVFRDGELVAERSVREIDGQLSAFLWGLNAETTYTAIATFDSDGGGADSNEVTFTTGPLPAGLPEVEILVHDDTRAHTGLVIIPLKIGEYQGYLGIDPQGEVGWYYLTDYVLGRPGGDLKVTEDGRFLIFRPGGAQIIEPWGEVVWDAEREFHHDLTLMPNGDLLTLVRRVETFDVVAQGGQVEVEVDGVRQITPDGELVQEWWLSDHLDHESWPSGLGLAEEPLDWSHGNAVVWLEDTRQIMLSLRHQLGVFMVDWDSGEIEWKLGPGGDFTLLDGDENDWFYNQHSPELQPDGTWLIYDNGNERPNQGQYSRAVRMEIDEGAMTARVAWEHIIPNGTPVQGDADRLHNGNILSCAGGVLNTGNTPRLIEATNDEASEVVWELLVDGEGASNLYRATEIHDMDAL